jgi:hypothetical protein
VTWPEKIKALSISVAGQPTASLLKRSVFQLVYEATAQRCVGLGLPPGIPPALCQRMTVIWDTARQSL